MGRQARSRSQTSRIGRSERAVHRFAQACEVFQVPANEAGNQSLQLRLEFLQLIHTVNDYHPRYENASSLDFVPELGCPTFVAFVLGGNVLE
jgi:hypothetical protein